jgi:hypothetical protein
MYLSTLASSQLVSQGWQRRCRRMPDAKGVLAAQLEALPFRHSLRPLVRQVLVRTRNPRLCREAVEV